MPEAFNLRRMLHEIIEDEKVSTSKSRKVSQADIKKLLAEKRNDRRAAAEPAEPPDKEPSGPPSQIKDGDGSGSRESQTVKPPPDSSVPLKPWGILPIGTLIGPPPAGADDDGMFESSGRFTQLQIPSGVLPVRIMLKYRIIPLRAEDRVIELAMENPQDSATIHDVEILTGKRVEPVKVEPELMDRGLQSFRSQHAAAGFDSSSSRSPNDGGLLSTLLERLVVSEGSDLLVTQGASPWIKTPVHMERTGLPAVTVLDCVRCAKALMTENRWERFLAEGVVTFSHKDPVHGRFRVQVFRERGAPSLVIRRIPDLIPTIEELGLPDWLEDTLQPSGGLVIITGPSGHGKTTTLHALVHNINTHKAKHVITLEDPIEYVHHPGMSRISQREIGEDVSSCCEGIKQARRQGADVIVVGELHSSEALLEALAAAQSGRLVLTTFLAGDTRQAIEQLIRTAPPFLQSYALSMMRDTLLLIMAQKLLPSSHDAGVYPVCEKLQGAIEIRDLLQSIPVGMQDSKERI